MDFKKQKLSSQFKQCAAEFIKTESNRTSLITVTDAVVSFDHKHCTILLTVFPDTEEKTVFEFLSRKHKAFRHFVKSHSRVGFIPSFSFQKDHGEKNRQRIEQLKNEE